VTPLPAPLGGTELVGWRLDQAIFATTWDTGEGAYVVGGRWNSKGIRAVYCSIDPATAILEVAVHKGFRALDAVPHVLTAINLNPTGAFVVQPATVPNPNWLRPGIPTAGQQAFGDDVLTEHEFIVIPSAVSNKSWNVIFVASKAAGAYSVRSQEEFALDARLHRPELHNK
jgi:RES domain-containing protein